MPFATNPKSLVRQAQDNHSSVARDYESRIQYLRVDYVHTAGANTGTIEMGKVVTPLVEIYPQLSIFGCSQMAANADVHLGYRYVDLNGATQTDDNFWMDNVDSGGGAITADLFGNVTGVVAAGLVPASNIFLTQSGVDIIVLVDTGNIEDTDTITLRLAYSSIS